MTTTSAERRQIRRVKGIEREERKGEVQKRKEREIEYNILFLFTSE